MATSHLFKHYLTRMPARAGLVVGILFFCAALTPSLLPRAPLLQGVLAGVVFTVGYGLGSFLVVLWRYLEIPEFRAQIQKWLFRVLVAAAVILAVVSLNRMVVWQNSIRGLMEMPDIERGYPFQVTGLAIVIAVIILFLSRCLRWLAKLAQIQVNKVLPRRLSMFIAVALVALATIGVVNGILIQQAVRIMDESFALLDQLTPDGVEEPAGFAGSLIPWDTIGRNGKRFLTDGPDQQDLSKFSGKEARQPLRVYAGYNTADTVEKRAEIALKELERQGGFQRKNLIVAVPTGTGWLDPAAIRPLPYVLGGDVAIVSVQYSYLPSWLTLILDPDRPRLAARAIFRAVFQKWTSLPKESRPNLYLFGLSLGGLGAEAAIDLSSLVADPIDGALLAGPPFASGLWRQITNAREKSSPEWRPRYGDGSLVRFMNLIGFGDETAAPWGPMRIVYLQHGSDPMTFFSPGLFYQRPDWLTEDRAPDVSPYLAWYPFVTFFSVGFDVFVATSAPPGYGHTFRPASYIDGWVAVLNPEGWREADTDRLKALFKSFVSSPL